MSVSDHSTPANPEKTSTLEEAADHNMMPTESFEPEATSAPHILGLFPDPL